MVRYPCRIRSRVQIEAAAKANGIQFVWETKKADEETSEDEDGEGDGTDDDNSESMNDDEV